MHGDPAADTKAERPDLGFAPVVVDPYADAPRRPAPGDPQFGQCRDQPRLERADESPDVAAAPIEIEQHITDALARPVVGIAPAPSGRVNRKALRIEQF